jgi:hypothetical protein
MTTASGSGSALAVLVALAAATPAFRGDQDAAKPKPAVKPAEKSVTVDFEKDEAGKPPKEFTVALTGGGPTPEFVIAAEGSAPSGKQVLAQKSADATDYRFPLCIYEKFLGADVAVSVRFKAVEGKVDRAGGVVLRYKDKDNYCIARANALEDNVRLYHVVAGKRVQFAGEKAKVSSGEWHMLKLEARGNHFKVFFDGDKPLFEADDDTLKDTGKVGVWTKADSVTLFDDFKVERLEEKAAPK